MPDFDVEEAYRDLRGAHDMLMVKVHAQGAIIAQLLACVGGDVPGANRMFLILDRIARNFSDSDDAQMVEMGVAIQQTIRAAKQQIAEGK